MCYSREAEFWSGEFFYFIGKYRTFVYCSQNDEFFQDVKWNKVFSRKITQRMRIFYRFALGLWNF
jgi:hypothetical protein